MAAAARGNAIAWKLAAAELLAAASMRAARSSTTAAARVALGGERGRVEDAILKLCKEVLQSRANSEP